ncbi:MAG: ectoine synthase [Lautropia sp.]
MNQFKIIHPDDVTPILLRNGDIVSRRLVTKKKDGSANMSFHVNVIKGGVPRTDDVVYPDQDEINYMIKGKGVIICNGERHPVSEGMIWNIPAGQRYGLENDDEVVIISVFSPPRE